MTKPNGRVPVIGSKTKIDISVLDEDLRQVALRGGLPVALEIQVIRELRKLNETQKEMWKRLVLYGNQT